MTTTASPHAATPATPSPRISPRKLAHIVLRTRTNYEAMVDWYCKVLDAEVVYRSPRISFLSYDDEHHRIAIARGDDLADRPHRAVGLDHVAFTYAEISDLLATYSRLKGEGVMPFCNVNHGPTTSLYYADPDNNRIELQVDNFEDMHEATELMNDNFDVNPVGEEFDADTWIARLEAGERPEDIVRPRPDPKPPTPELIASIRSS